MGRVLLILLALTPLLAWAQPVSLPFNWPAGTQAPGFVDAATASGVLVDAYRQSGDADDTAAFIRAVGSGSPVVFGPRAYVINGAISVSKSVVLAGVPRRTVIQQTVPSSGSAWIVFSAPSVVISGITFDGNKAAVTSTAWCVQITSGVADLSITDSRVTNCPSATAPALGIQGNNAISGKLVIDRSEFDNNNQRGVWVFTPTNLSITNSFFHDNAGVGLSGAGGAGNPTNISYRFNWSGNYVWNNAKGGIQIGSLVVANTTPPQYGTSNPSAAYHVISRNHVYNNGGYQIAIEGDYILCSENTVVKTSGVATGAAGIGVFTRYSRISGNRIYVTTESYGIDAGGSNVHEEIDGNYIYATRTPLNAGGSQNVNVHGNHIAGPYASLGGIVLNFVETDGADVPFELTARDINIHDNTVEVPSSGQYGVYVLDGVPNVQVTGNRFIGANISAMNMVRAYTGTLFVRNNLVNGVGRYAIDQAGAPDAPTAANGYQVVIPDGVDVVYATGASPVQVNGFATKTFADSNGQLLWLTPTAGGSGYTTASVEVVCAGGTNPTATAFVFAGAVIGYRVGSRGALCGAGNISVTITGDGSGAVAAAAVGNVGPQGQDYRFYASSGAAVNVGSRIRSASGRNLMLPASSEVVLRSLNGAFWVSGYPNGMTFQSTADAALGATADTSCVGAGQGIQTVAGGLTPVGASFSLRCAGTYSTPPNNAATMTIKGKWGSAVLASVAATMPSNAVAVPWRFFLDCAVRSVGASGSAACNGGLGYIAGGAEIYAPASTLGASIDTTAPARLDVTAAWSSVVGGQTATSTNASIGFVQ